MAVEMTKKMKKKRMISRKWDKVVTQMKKKRTRKKKSQCMYVASLLFAHVIFLRGL